MTNPTLTMLKAGAFEWQMDYQPFQYPIEVTESGLVFRFGTVTNELELTPDGITMLLQHLHEFVDRKKARRLYAGGDLRQFADYINTCRAAQVDQYLWRKNQTYILAVARNKICGVLAHYNPKSNLEVLNDIDQSGLASNVTRGHVELKKMNVYLRYKNQDGFEMGLNVRNGETGHATLSYRLYVNQDDYTFSTPKYGKRRHLSNLTLVEDDLKSAYGELSDLKFHDYVMNTESLSYATLLLANPELEKLHDLVLPYQSRLSKLYSLLGMLATQRSIRGYKGICTDALDLVYTKIVESI